MPRLSKALPGPSRLSAILENLKKPPRPTLSALRELNLTLASRNDHFGARHFIKEELPRIRYANPELNIQINKVPKSAEDTWKAELSFEFKDGRKSTIDMSQKWSSQIFEELMDAAGGERWKQFKETRKANGEEPVFPTVISRTPSTPRTGVAAALP